MPRPATTPIHVAVTVPRSDPAAQHRAVATVTTLKDAGMDATLTVELRPTNGPPVTYFYPNDQPAAAAIARQIGEAGHERLATTSPPPRPGTIRVLISHGQLLTQRTP